MDPGTQRKEGYEWMWGDPGYLDVLGQAWDSCGSSDAPSLCGWRAYLGVNLVSRFDI